MQRSTFLRIGFLTLIIGTLAGAGSALAGFATGDAYLKAPDSYKLGYAAGAIDMLARPARIEAAEVGGFQQRFPRRSSNASPARRCDRAWSAMPMPNISTPIRSASRTPPPATFSSRSSSHAPAEMHDCRASGAESPSSAAMSKGEHAGTTPRAKRSTEEGPRPLQVKRRMVAAGKSSAVRVAPIVLWDEYRPRSIAPRTINTTGAAVRHYGGGHHRRPRIPRRRVLDDLRYPASEF